MTSDPRVSFKQVFPQIEDIKVEVEQIGPPTYSPTRKEWNTRCWPEQLVKCHNRVCPKGFLNLWEIIGRMVDQRQTERQDETMCPGYEGSPKLRRVYGKCLNMFTYKIRIKYRQDFGS